MNISQMKIAYPLNAKGIEKLVAETIDQRIEVRTQHPRHGKLIFVVPRDAEKFRAQPIVDVYPVLERFCVSHPWDPVELGTPA